MKISANKVKAYFESQIPHHGEIEKWAVGSVYLKRMSRAYRRLGIGIAIAALPALLATLAFGGDVAFGVGLAVFVVGSLFMASRHCKCVLGLTGDSLIVLPLPRKWPPAATLEFTHKELSGNLVIAHRSARVLKLRFEFSNLWDRVECRFEERWMENNLEQAIGIITALGASEKERLLVAALVSNDEATFIGGLREAVSRADSGDLGGVRVLREAMRERSGKSTATFYRAGVVLSGGLDRYRDARTKIVDLAKRYALLDDPECSGDLVSAFVSMNDQNALRDLLLEIYATAGRSQGYAFQLLFNELRCSARFDESTLDGNGN